MKTLTIVLRILLFIILAITAIWSGILISKTIFSSTEIIFLFTICFSACAGLLLVGYILYMDLINYQLCKEENRFYNEFTKRSNVSMEIDEIFKSINDNHPGYSDDDFISSHNGITM